MKGLCRGRTSNAATMGTLGHLGHRGRKMGRGTKPEDHYRTTWEFDRICDCPRKKTLLTKTKQSFSQHVTGSQKPQSLREMNNLIKEQSGHIHRHQQDRALESYPVGKNLNSGKRHLMGDVHRHGVN